MTLSPAAIFLESNTTGSGEAFLRQARALGMHPVLLAADPSRYRFAQRLPRLEIRTCDTSDDTAVSACIDSVASARAVRLVLSTSDYYVEQAVRQITRLGLSGPSPEAVALCRDKGGQIAALRAQGVPVPAFAGPVRRNDDIEQVLDGLDYPVVVKPVSGSGSVGVRLAQEREAARQTIDDILSRTHNDRGQFVEPAALITAFVGGPEFSVEVLDGTSVGATAKHLGPLPHFVEIGHDFPADLPREIYREIEATAESAVAELGLSVGPAHVELRLSPSGPVIIEVNPRLAGGSIPDLVSLTTGVDLVRTVICRALGQPLPKRDPARSFGALRFVVPPQPGPYSPALSKADLVSKYGLQGASFYRDFPVVFQPRHDFTDRLGHVIAVRSDPATARECAEQAVASLHQPETYQ